MNFCYSRRPNKKLEIEFENEELFDQIRSVLANEMGATEGRLLESLDQIYLDFSLGNAQLRLHWDNYCGLVLIAVDSASEESLRKFGELLARHGFECKASLPR
jgi:hypothetical protein